ncbi:MAG: hypothetical protein JSR76_01020 [Verrucomicrobia bacterium]|nr:hypothetical protein [Verrucomicrobiota bacterium]
MFTEDDKKYILNQFLRTIWGISNIEYQNRTWIQGEGPNCDDFEETCCHFFDDGDPILKNYKEYKITDEQYVILLAFRKEFQAFSSLNNWPQLFIDTPKWTKITERAKEVLEAFNYKKE